MSTSIVGQGGYGLSGASNPSVGTNGGGAVGSSTQFGTIVAGVFQPVNATYPLPISGNITASNAAVGVIGATAPTSADFLGVIDGSGKLRGVGASNPVRVDPTGTTSQPVELFDSSGNGISSTTGYLNVYIQGGGSGGTQYTDLTAETAGAFTITAAGLYNGTDVVGLRGDASNNLYVNLHTALPAGTNVIGHVIVDSGAITASIAASQTIAVTNTGTFAVQAAQTTAANLNATVVGTGTFAVQATIAAGTAVIGHVIVDSGTITTVSAVTAITNALPAGTNVIGHVIVDSGTITTVSAVTAITNALPAGTNVIGHVITDSGSTTAVTGSVAVTGTFYQATQPVSLASGQVASGAIASGAIAAGAVAAGAFVSGSVLSGALASGAVVDLTNVTSALAATAPTKALATSGLAATALPTAVTGGQAVLPMTDKFGRQVVLTGAPRDIVGTAALTITASTGSNSLIAAIASTYCDITSLTITNSSATATLLTLSDGTTSYIFSAGVGPGWGVTIPFNPPLPAASVNTAWTLTCGTSVSSVYVVAQYIKNK